MFYVEDIKPQFGPQSGGVELSIQGNYFLTPQEMDQHCLNVVFSVNNNQTIVPVHYIDSKEIRVKLPKVDVTGIARVSFQLTSHNGSVKPTEQTLVFNYVSNDEFRSINSAPDQQMEQAKLVVQSFLTAQNKNPTRVSILHIAACLGMSSVIRYILNSSKTCLVDAKDNFGCTPLFW